MISSPMPKPENYNRVIADEFPQTTFSRSYFDTPLRNEVQQINIPTAITKVTTERYDPRVPLKQPVSTFSGTLLHNTGSTNENIVQGLPSFLGKSEKKVLKHRKHLRNHRDYENQGLGNSNFLSDTRAAVENARAVYNRSSSALNVLKNGIAPPINNNLHSHFEKGEKMIIPVQMTNKLEQQSLLLNDNEAMRQASINEYRDTPAGVRSLHTYRRLK